MRYLGAINKNAADIRKKHDKNKRTYAQPTLHTRKECLMKAHYHNIHGHSLKGVVSSESGHGVSVCVLAQRSPQTNVLTVTTMERQSKHVCASATCQVAKSHVRSKTGCNMPPMTANE